MLIFFDEEVKTFWNKNDIFICIMFKKNKIDFTGCGKDTLIVTPAVYPRLGINYNIRFFSSTRLRISKPNSEYSHGFPEFPQSKHFEANRSTDS